MSGSDLASVRTRATRTAERLAAQRPEDLDHQRAALALHDRAGAHLGRRPRTGSRGCRSSSSTCRCPASRCARSATWPATRISREVFFDDVELGDDALIGDEGGGWEQVTAELAFERSGPERIYSSIVLLDRGCNGCATPDASRRDALARAGRAPSPAHLAVLRALSIAVTARLAAGHSPVVEAALVKDLGTELRAAACPPCIADALARRPRRGRRRRTAAHARLPRRRWRPPSRCAAARAKCCAA